MVATSLVAICALQPFNSVLAHSPHTLVVGHHHIQQPPPPPPIQSSPTVNVKDFGAKGDGTTDDTSSIQNAVASAQSSHKGVFFPPGTYLHNSVLTFGSVAVTGSGAACTLLAGDKNNTAVILTGTNSSIQNIVISSSGLTGSSSGTKPNSATVLVQTATQFTVANDTIVQGSGRYGVYLQKSSVGTVSANAINGTGSSGDTGVVIDGCFNVSVLGNLFQNEDVCVSLFPFSGLLSGFGSQFVAILNNVCGNVTFPTKTAAVVDVESNTLSFAQNVVQMASFNKGTAAVQLTTDANIQVFSNEIWNGLNGVVTTSLFQAGNNIVSQNIFRNIGSSALLANGLLSPIAVQFISNKFGECGLIDTSANSAVITVNGSTNGVANVKITNNVYQGHVNDLVNYVYAKNVPPANITGNTQSQTNLPGVPNN
jgi:hypothetical protein